MDHRPVILDGGLATQLEADGFQLQGDPLWSARLLHTNPKAIKEVHYRYLQSGSDVITTATYQASIAGFVKYLGFGIEESEGLMMSGVHLAKEAVQDFLSLEKSSEDRRKPLVAGSVGPYGAFLHDGSEYTGAYENGMTVEELKDWHRPQIQSLVKAGVDLVALETIPGLKEAEALIDVLKEFPETKAWLSFSCKDNRHISSGRTFSEAVQMACRSSQLVAVGVNCCPSTLVTPLLESAMSQKENDLSWVVYPNSGENWDSKTGWQTENWKSYANLTLDWKERGAMWIGGCCRVGPADITELKKQLLHM